MSVMCPPMRSFGRWVFIGAGLILVFTFTYFRRFHVPAGPEHPHSAPSSVSEVPGSSSDPLLSHIHNETLGFERVIVVSLPKRTDRRDATLLAASLTGFKVEFQDAVDGNSIADKQLPPGVPEGMVPGQKGCWRSHLDVYAKMIQEDISSALIMEDDADWDIRLKSQLTEFALAARILSQPVSSNSYSRADPTFDDPSESKELAPEFQLKQPPSMQIPTRSPYGDTWDLLWFGHCATRFPVSDRDRTQRGRVIMSDDKTVAQTQFYASRFGSDEITRIYPNHTRVAHHTAENACTQGYAITKKAAKQLLYEFGVKELTAPIDILLRKYCDGLDGQDVHNCYTTTPTYMDHWIPRGSQKGASDISALDGYYEHDWSFNIRLSAKNNLKKLVDGHEPVDQYPDAQT